MALFFVLVEKNPKTHIFQISLFIFSKKHDKQTGLQKSSKKVGKIFVAWKNFFGVLANSYSLGTVFAFNKSPRWRQISTLWNY